MVNPLRGIFGVQRVPVCGFVGMNGCGRRNDSFDEGEAVRFALGYGRNGAPLALAGHDHDAALASLVLSKTAVDPVFFAVGWLDMAAKIATVNLDRAGKGSALDFGSDGFAELVSENEGRLVLAIDIAGKLEHGDALHRICENNGSSKKVNESHLPAGEDRAACDAELVAARPALELAAGGDRVSIYAAAARANWLSLSFGPAHPAKRLMRFVFAALINRAQGQGASCCRK